jgi:hypothetical protein
MGDSCPCVVFLYCTDSAGSFMGDVMSSMKGIASAVITMHKLGKPTDEIQAMLDASEYRDAKREVLNMVSTYINNITQQQVAQAIRQGETL